MGASHLSGPLYVGGVPVPQLGGAIAGRVLYVRQSGAPADFPEAYGSMTLALAAANDGDTIVLLSDLREEVDFPADLFDVTIIGNGATPRHDDKHNWTSGFHLGTASWRNSSGVTTTPLAKLRQQGIRFINILFDCPTSAAAVELYRNAESGEDEQDASHASFYGCRFAGGETGIEVIGTENLFNVTVKDCVFQDLTDGIKGLNAYRWLVQGNRFVDCTNCIDVAAVDSTFVDNVMVGADPTKGFDLTGGGTNTVTRNVFAGDYNVLNVAGTGDNWAGNIAQDETAALTTTTPSGS